MTKIQTLLQENTPFAIMQYFESFKGIPTETYKKYELIYVNIRNEIAFKVLNDLDVIFLKENLNIIKKIITTKEGKIHEFNNFKNFKENLNLNH